MVLSSPCYPNPMAAYLFGGNFLSLCGSTRYALFRLKPDGQLDETFDARLDMSSVFSIVRQPSGQILVGGLLNRTGASNSAPLLRLNADLQWDESFQTAAFGGTGGSGGPSISALLPPTGRQGPRGRLLLRGGRLLASGDRAVHRWRASGRVLRSGPRAGGYIRSLGLSAALTIQPDGRIVIGGSFQGIETALRPIQSGAPLAKERMRLDACLSQGRGSSVCGGDLSPRGGPTTWRCSRRSK